MNKRLTIATVLVLADPVLCSGQDFLDPSRFEIDRPELSSLLSHYDAIVQSTAYSDVLRDEVRVQVDIIRARLTLGDFQAGDEIVLSMGEGDIQLEVESGPMIDVPSLGPILLRGVLRSELETHLTREIGRFIQTPRIQARALIRVSVSGAVGQPGFYALPTNTRLSDVVTLAGGPTGGGDPGQIRVERGTDELWSLEELLAQVAAGRTLDDVGIQPQDRIIVVPGASSSAALSGLGRSAQNFAFLLLGAFVTRLVY